MEYTGQGCSATSHSQAPDKVSCAGDPAFTTPVHIRVIDKENPNDPKAKVWFDGFVTLNSTFFIDATNGGKTKLGSKTFVFISDLQDNLLQTIEFHTSCSQPLKVVDQFGSLLLVDVTLE
ncbi:MAG: hypothetical protein IID33_12540 [Planctomycetes bacterium]|nr:hypothetical protein [Planctomycetota bacterium]